MEIIINGINGRMGRMVLDTISEEYGLIPVAGFDKTVAGIDPPIFGGAALPVYSSPYEYDGKADVIVDFSNFSAIPALMGYAVSSKTPVVVATTALGEEERQIMREASKTVPVFNSSNMSLGINLVAEMCKKAIPVLESNFNVEIIEKHHNKKADSPSGTALLLADAINETCEVKKDYVYGRHGKHDECKITDLGVHAIRGGTIPGQHTVLFAGPDEVIEITHTVYSRKVFALGAIKAAKFIADKAPGMYSMDDLI
jgi:4-hydroxy-tetrahydrodipicolinate reductase